MRVVGKTAFELIKSFAHRRIRQASILGFPSNFDREALSWYSNFLPGFRINSSIYVKRQSFEVRLNSVISFVFVAFCQPRILRYSALGVTDIFAIIGFQPGECGGELISQVGLHRLQYSLVVVVSALTPVRSFSDFSRSVLAVKGTSKEGDMGGFWTPHHRKKISEHRITARKVNETPSPQLVFLAPWLVYVHLK